jgi:ribosomal protein S27E
MKNQLTQEQIAEVLVMFCDIEHQKDYAKIPHTQNGFVWATDGHSMVCIDERHVVNQHLKDIDKPVFSDVLPHYTGQKPIVINVQKMIDFLKSHCRLIDAMLTVQGDCPECKKAQIVFCNMGHAHDCTACDGTGKAMVEKPTGNKIPDPDTVFFDGFGLFSYRQMMRILQAADVLGLKEIEQKQGAEHDPYYYEIGAFKALMMPIYGGDLVMKNAIHFTHNT